MKREKFIQAALTDQEYKEFMVKYTNQLIAGKCTGRSDYIRQMLGVNGSQPDKSNEIKEEIVNEGQVNEIADKKPKYTASQLSIDFGKLNV
jgi:hypothetical protein